MDPVTGDVDMPLPRWRRAATAIPSPWLGRHAGVVRVFLPGARAVAVVAAADGAPLGALNPTQPAGFFAGTVSAAVPYRLRITWPDAVQETEDPYAFAPLLGELDLHLIAEGRHREIGRVLGAHAVTVQGVPGVRFAVWAPNAQRVSVVGDFNGWDGLRHPMRRRIEAGVWEIFIPRLAPGARYKYELLGPDGALLPQKADPCGGQAERAPATASIVPQPLDPADGLDGGGAVARAGCADVDLRGARRAPGCGMRMAARSPGTNSPIG